MYKNSKKIHSKNIGWVFMRFFKTREKKEILNSKIDNLITLLEKSNLEDIGDLFASKKELIKRNFLGGLFRGIGIGMGVTIITAILLIVLRRIVALNIPIIGEYISDIVEIVEKSK